MSIVSRGGIVQRHTREGTTRGPNGLVAHPEMPFLYNAAGLKRWFDSRPNAAKNSAGTGLKGARVRGLWDSLGRGMAATNARRDTIGALTNKALQGSRWQGGIDGGEGLVLARCGDAGANWPAVGSTIGSGTTQAVWTASGTWTVTSAPSINNLRCTGTSAASSRMRCYFDGSISPVTSFYLIVGKEAVAGTLTWDLYTDGDAFITAGTGASHGGATGTVDMNAASAGGIVVQPAGLASLNPGTDYTVQVAITSGTGYFEGVYANNGDENSGLGYHDACRVGASSADATFPGSEAGLVATIDRACTYAGTSDTFTTCFVVGLFTNDAGAQTTIANYEANLGIIADRVNSASGGFACVLFVVPMLYDTGYLSNPITFELYRQAMYRVVAARPTFCAILDCYEAQGLPTVVTPFEAVPKLWIDTAHARHHTDAGCAKHAELLSGALLLEAAA